MHMNWDILIRAIQNNITADEEVIINCWLSESTHNENLFKQMTIQQDSMNVLITKSTQEKQWQLLQQRLQKPVINITARKLFIKIAITVAAIFIAVILTNYFMYSSQNSSIQTFSFNKISTSDKERKKVILPDGTTVWLHYSSTLQFDQNSFNKKNRTVELVGDAFFDVTKNKQKPFVIKLNSIAVNVVGTSFSISSREHSVQKIKVSTGIVSVTGKHMNEQLFAGNAISYNLLTQQIIRSNTDVKEAEALKDNQLFFHKDNLSAIAEKLESWYNRKVIIAAPSNIFQKPISFTGLVKDDGIETVLNGISYVAGFTYTINDREIIIYPQH